MRMLGVLHRGVFIMLPVLHERENIAGLLDRIEQTLRSWGLGFKKLSGVSQTAHAMAGYSQ